MHNARPEPLRPLITPPVRRALPFGRPVVVFARDEAAGAYPDTSDPVLSAASADDQKVADLMSSYWVNFARTGDPNGPGLPTWRPHEVGNSDTAIILDAHPETESLPPRERLQTIDERFNAARAGGN